MKVRYFIIFILLLLFCVTAHAADQTAASLSGADINTAIDDCYSTGGGTVTLPAGTQDFDNNETKILLAPGVSLKGQGKTLTKLQNAYFHVKIDTDSEGPHEYGYSGPPVGTGYSTISDIGWYNGTPDPNHANRYYTYVDGAERVVIEDCHLEGKHSTAMSIKRSDVLVSECTIVWYTGYGAYVNGDNEWIECVQSDEIESYFGTMNSRTILVIEDCNFLLSADHIVDCRYGGNYIFRHNNVDWDRGGIPGPIECHGFDFSSSGAPYDWDTDTDPEDNWTGVQDAADTDLSTSQYITTKSYRVTVDDTTAAYLYNTVSVSNPWESRLHGFINFSSVGNNTLGDSATLIFLNVEDDSDNDFIRMGVQADINGAITKFYGAYDDNDSGWVTNTTAFSFAADTWYEFDMWWDCCRWQNDASCGTSENKSAVQIRIRERNSNNNYTDVIDTKTADITHRGMDVYDLGQYSLTALGSGGTFYLYFDDFTDTDAASGNRHEIYDNIFVITNGTAPTSNTGIFMRGGSFLVYNNDISGRDTGVLLILETSPDSGWISDAAHYPYYNQVGNCYIWDNTFSVTDTEVCISGETCSASSMDTNFVKVGREFWTDERGSYAFTSGTSLPGTCTDDDCYWRTDTKALYRCKGDNNWDLVYTEMTYPHVWADEDAPELGEGMMRGIKQTGGMRGIKQTGGMIVQ
jgi:hypothetical protein